MAAFILWQLRVFYAQVKRVKLPVHAAPEAT